MENQLNQNISYNNIENESLNQPADQSLIEGLFKKGLLDKRGKETALNLTRPPLNWWQWLDRFLLFLGSALILSGIVFFFAYNWAHMGDLFKFLLIESGIIISILGILKIGLEKIVGKILLLSASLLVGVFLAVFGQVYQTGADAYELFTGWLVLIIGWVIISKFAALWMMWLVLGNTAIILYWSQVLYYTTDIPSSTLFIILALINTTALVLTYLGKLKKVQWLSSSWFPRLILFSILTYLTIPSISFIIDYHLHSFLPLLLLILFFIIGYFFFQHQYPDLVSLTLCTFFACIVFLTFMGRLIFSNIKDAGGFLLLGFIVLIIFSAATYWLRQLAKKINFSGDKNVPS